MILKEGTLLKNGDYRIGKVLGQGGFGITYLADQVALGRKVAVKEFFMKEHCNRDEDSSVSVGSLGSKGLVAGFKAKFMKEARMIAALSNPHIISIHDVFEENGTAYYVMEYLEGKSLSALVRERGMLSEADAVMYTRHIADALNEVHANNLLHLDVKPVNVMLNKKGEAVLIDFGVSKHYDDAGGQTSSAALGMSEGYAPLEQYEAGALKSFTPATDIYALGATLYFMLAGERPPKASSVMNDGLPEIPRTVSPFLRHAVETAMEPRRKERPQSVDEFLALLDSEPAAAPETTPDTVVADDAGETRIVADRTEKTEIAAAPLPSGQNAHAVEPADARAQVGNNAGKPAGENKQPAGPKPKKRRVFLWVLLFVILAAAGVLCAVLLGNCNPAIEAFEEFLDNPTVENAKAVVEAEKNLDEEQKAEYDEWMKENEDKIVEAAEKVAKEAAVPAVEADYWAAEAVAAPAAPKELKSTNTEPVERPAEPAKITSEEKSVPEPVREVDEQAELNAENADIFNKSGNIKKPEEEPVMDPGVHTDPTPGSGNSVSVSFGDGKGRGYTKAPYNGAVPQEGTIVVEVTVSPEGKVIGEPRIASGSDIADNAFRRRVLENAKKFKFDGANRPDNQVATITYKFTVK